MKMNGSSKVNAAKAVPVAKATKVTAEHLWSKGTDSAGNQNITAEKANKFDGSSNTADQV